MVEFPDRRGQQSIQGVVDQISRLMVKVPLEVVADPPDKHLLLITTHRHERSVLLEEHNGVEKGLLLCGFVDEVIASPEDGVILNTVPKVLYCCWFQFLVLDEDTKAEEVELPSPID